MRVQLSCGQRSSTGPSRFTLISTRLCIDTPTLKALTTAVQVGSGAASTGRTALAASCSGLGIVTQLVISCFYRSPLAPPTAATAAAAARAALATPRRTAAA